DFEVWNAQYPCRVAQIADPLPYPPFDTTSAIWVGDPPALSAMLAQLKTCSEIAVDLEHHDYRSFAGFVCLMQISSRDQDWIVDTLLLRQELQSLNAVFADPAILKVFHGARMDILWLQRDFSLYIVSLFDTFHAAKSLHLSSRSLAFLLKRYADFDADKKYQLADWRIRPLPQEMLAYARSDTHFLLFVYDNLRNQLVQNDRLQHVLTASRAVAAQSYQRPAYDPDGWKSLYAKYGSAKLLSNTQIAAFTALHQWRDRIARHLDESLRYVLPTHLMVSIAAALPKDLPQLYACTLPPVAKDYANDILQLVSAHHSDSYHSDSLHSDSLHSDSHHSDSHHSDSHSRPDSHHSDSHSRPELLASISSFWTSLHQNEPNHNLLKQLGSQLRVAVPLPCSPKVEAAALAVHPFKPTPDDIIIPRTGKKRSLQILPYENLQPVHTRKKKKHRLEETSSLDPHKKL
ncbi:Exosome complex exonuclease rrp6, partial [Neolecta irregularis DAH-3]